MENNILSNQLVVLSREDYESIVEDRVNAISSYNENKIYNRTRDGVIINPITCNGFQFITRIDASRILNVGLPTLWRWNNEGYLKAIKVGKRRVYYLYNDIIGILKGEKENG